MSEFWKGFEKRAEDKSWTDKLKTPAAAAIGTGVGAYALLRKPWKSAPTFNRILETTGKSPGKVRHFIDSILHGADKVHYGRIGQTLPDKPKYLKGIVAGGSQDTLIFRGNRTFGVAKNKEVKRLVGRPTGSTDKAYEARLIQKYAPEYAIETKVLTKKDKGKRALRRIHNQFIDKNYFIKHRRGEASGVGGIGFINSKDVAKFLATGKVDKTKKTLMDKVMSKPSSFIVQPDIGIKKTKILGTSRELRVHSVGDKVVSGATMVRGSNVLDSFNNKSAEKFFQKFLDRLPKKLKEKDIMLSPDIAVTDKGFKIIELNPGAIDSGLMDPKYLWHKFHNPVAALAATRASHKLYKHVMGKEHSASAIVKGLTAAGGTYAAGKQIEKQLEKQ